MEIASIGTSALVSVAELAPLLGDESLLVIDCRFVLNEVDAGRDAYLEAHIPGARYAHLESELSGPPNSDCGRHPLPSPNHLCKLFGYLGIAPGIRVVVYDDSYGMVAARLWWMLRYMGHATVAVLDGGWQSWTAAGLEVTAGHETGRQRRFTGRPDSSRLMTVRDIDSATPLVDAREAARFRGEIEPIDPVAGHIPGALNHCWRDNLRESGTFLELSALRESFVRSLGQLPDHNTTHYCGSGVSACHNILAQVAAGLPEPRLYCGSWSEWCRVMIDAGPPTEAGTY
jgi:thiosulfate/3-mercaptopyruvate sulfurtransferase